MSKKNLSERDICTKFITPAIEKAGWDKQTQFLEEVSFTAGKIYVRGKMTARGKGKRADYILYYKPNIPIAIVEAKDNKHSVRAGIQQALDYAKILDIPCVFSSNGDGFLFHDRTAIDARVPGGQGNLKRNQTLTAFPRLRHSGRNTRNTKALKRLKLKRQLPKTTTLTEAEEARDTTSKLQLTERLKPLLKDKTEFCW